MRGKIAIASGAIAAAAAVLMLIYATPTPASVSISFKGYAPHPYRYTNLVCGMFVISNTGPRSVRLRGVGASSEYQLTQMLSERGWIDAKPSLSPFAASFWLSPGQSREVPVLAENDVPWRIRFRFREWGFVDLCPEILWERLPDGLRKMPRQSEATTEAVPAYDHHLVAEQGRITRTTAPGSIMGGNAHRTLDSLPAPDSGGGR